MTEALTETAAAHTPPPNSETEVLIAGAGPVGMTLALTLRRAGIPVTIVDKAPQTRRFSQAAVLWPRTLEILDLLGVVGDWQGHTVPLHGFQMNVDGEAVSLDMRPTDSPHPLPLGVGQDVTEALLDARLRASGADYRRGVEVTAVTVDADGATAALRSADGTAQTVRASWIVGCEGSHSPVREAAGITRQGGKNAGVLVQGDVRVGGTLTREPGRGFLWAGTPDGAHRALLILPIHPDGHCRVLAALPDDGTQGDPTLEELQAVAQQFVPGLTLSDPVWLNHYRTQQQIADTYRAGRAFVAGDAAHVWVPVGGQGMNIGMQDAFDLGWKLAGVIRGELPDDALNTHEAERRPIGAQNISDTDHLYGAILSPRGLLDRALRRLIPHALSFHGVDARVTERFSELDFHYPAGRLVSQHGQWLGPAAGMRAPDAFVVRAGVTLRLYDLYRAGGWTVLGWAAGKHGAGASGTEANDVLQSALADLPGGEAFLVDATADGVPGGPVETLRDAPQLAAQAYEVHAPQVHIIRPDGVIGYRGPAVREPLQAYFAAVSGSAPQ